MAAELDQLMIDDVISEIEDVATGVISTTDAVGGTVAVPGQPLRRVSRHADSAGSLTCHSIKHIDDTTKGRSGLVYQNNNLPN